MKKQLIESLIVEVEMRAIPLRLFITGKIFSLMPPTRLFAIKRRLLRWSGLSVGQNVRVASSVRFLCSGPVVIGDNTWIGHDVLITGGGAEIVIGSDVDIGPRVTIVSGSHVAQPGKKKAAGGGVSLPIRISNGVWVGAGAIVIGGASIGESSIVAAGALIKGECDPGRIYAGVPGKIIKGEN